MVHMLHQRAKPAPFPTINVDFTAGEGHWPSPPFAWDHETIDRNALQPCRLQLCNGREIDGELCGFEPLAARLLFRPQGATATAAVPFAHLRTCTLTQPLTPRRFAGTVPTPEHERSYRIAAAGGAMLSGSTVGRVETACGMFLFPPVDVDRSLLRLFVPRSAYRQAEFGPTAVEKAAAAWITTPGELLAAIARQPTATVVQTGQAITNLGLATSSQIERALAAQAQTPDTPLGQILVAAGVVAQADLEAALAHKLGYPLVDVDRFPIDTRAMRLPLRTLMSLQALPLMLDGERIVMAVASPSREAGLRTLKATTGLTPVAVLARRSALARRLAALTERDVWEQAVPVELQPVD